MKTAIRGFCLSNISEIELVQRGLWKGYFTLYNKKKLDKFAFFWVDRDQMYFVSKNSSLKPGIKYARDRLRQLDDIPNVDPVNVKFEINQPRVSERYYPINSKID